MARLIGTVKQVVGDVFAVAGDGTRRLVIEGDRLYAGEQLQTGPTGAVAVRLAQGGELTLGRDSSMPLTPQILANHATHVDTPDAVTPSQQQLADVQQVQQAIAAGADPSQITDAPAAGTANPGGSPTALGGGHSFVLLTETAGVVTPVIGFPTAGISPSFIIPEPEVGLFVEGSPDASLPPVIVPPDQPPVVTPPDGPPVVTPPNEPPPVSVDHGVTLSASQVTLSEANLVNGSNPDASALTQTGTVRINAPDGLQTLTIGGINVIENGVAITSPQSVTLPSGSTFTVISFNPATGEVSYSYTLNGAETHNQGDGTVNDEQIPVHAVDTDGDVADGNITVHVTDDVPHANADIGHVKEGGETSGNILANDQAGADGPDAGGLIVGVRAGGDTSTPVTTGVGTVIQGLYGSLIVDANGNASYVANPNSGGTGDAQDVFTYTIRDADGDTSTTTITVNVYHNDGVTIGGGDCTVSEAHLPYGSDPDASALTQTGTVKINAPDGLQTLTIGGINVIENGVAITSPQSVTLPSGSTFTVISFNPATGEVSYSYTLNGAETHNQGDGAVNDEQIPVHAVDTDGDVADGNITVHVTDDVPQANADIGHVKEGGETSGNILANDQAGADGPGAGGLIVGVRAGGDTSTPVTTGVGTVIQGLYGSLIVDANGNASYVANPNSGGTGDAQDVFTYTIRDADGDTSTTTVTVNVYHNDGVTIGGGDCTVSEAHLPYGSDPDASALTQTGTVRINAPDGLQTLTIGGINVIENGVAITSPQSVTLPSGSTFTVISYNPATGEVSYSYTLNGAETHNQGDGTVNDEQIPVHAVDTDGDVADGNITVHVTDDVPHANADIGHVKEGGETSGNILANDQAGADGPDAGGLIVGVRAGGDTSTPVTTGVGTVIQGLYGSLIVDANGNASYVANPNSGGTGDAQDVFTYTIRDADGDTSTTTITVNVYHNDGVTIGGGDCTVDEGNLPGGSHPNPDALTQTGTLTIGAPDGLQTLTVGGINVIENGVPITSPQSTTLPSGNTLTITGYNPATGEVSYTYTLNGAQTHNQGDGTSVNDPISVHAVDSDGDVADGTVVVKILDDTPHAHCDIGNVAAGGEVSGNLLLNDSPGADGAGPSGLIVGVRAGGDTSTPVTSGLNTVITGLYGTLIVDSQGNATYHSNPALVGPNGEQDVFTYTIRDADGDTSTTTVTVNVAPPCPPVACNDHDVTVKESALDTHQDGKDLAPGTVTGSHPSSTAETGSGTLADSAHGGYGALTFSLDGGSNGTAQGQYGVLHLNADGSYTYTLTSAPKTTPSANDGPNVTHDTFTYTVTDSLGHASTAQIVVNIVDDQPKAACIEKTVTSEGINTNLMLIVDNSASMNQPSGVNGLSRLALEKQAIIGLLNQYEALGDVRVQLVTFNSQAHIGSNEWVDVATAKAMVIALQAGNGTNYDAALAAAQQAFVEKGAIAGAQNLAYFFSDGNPTLSTQHADPSHVPNPARGDGIDTGEEQAWTTFLETHHINAFAIGVGTEVSSTYLNPVAYNGAIGTDSNALIVTDLGQLHVVLSGTVQGGIQGSLLQGGTFGADQGFIKSVSVDGTTYTYDPKANQHQGAVVSSGGGATASFDSQSHTLTVIGQHGTLVLNMNTGDYRYTPAAGLNHEATENIHYVLSDNDGDLAAANLNVQIVPPPVYEAPVAVADHVITNQSGSSIVIPGAALAANDMAGNGGTLTASPSVFTTGWTAKGADFTASAVKTIGFAGTQDKHSNQLKNLDRSDFFNNTATTAMLVISGYLGAVNGAPSNAQDLYSVHLRAGETVTVDHNLTNDVVGMAWTFDDGAYHGIADGGTFTATEEGVYRLIVVNQADPGVKEHYTLNLTIDYAAVNTTPDVHSTYTVTDPHGGSSTAALTIAHQDGHTVLGTTGDDVLVGAADSHLHGGDGNDVLVAGPGTNELFGDNGDDMLFSGSGNDLLDGGAGHNTANYSLATAGVTVSTAEVGPQHTGGAGTDTLVNIQNLIGSNYDDHLTGDQGANLLNGGMGNDVLNGGAGDDILIGGPGNNVLTGGPGHDTFLYQAGNTGHDTITDFHFGIDKLDLSQLLQGEHGDANSLENFLHFSVSGNGASLVSTIDVSSVAGGATTQTIDLAGVNLAQQYGVSPGAGGMVAAGHDTASIINGMLGDHSLKVDTV
ncbi:retention module-containing protein [Pseudomonas sp. RIT412]|uniref:retention module-containing protein n=1 Tax=Pseudomonas sp. RIT412 TaxID=2202161 RepID=UPI000DCB39EA|nr:retention module-containing protein [Pseudomonas sp. RIT 412]RAU56017.1 RTX toxin [Pseudomonas sp. RIT 412]